MATTLDLSALVAPTATRYFANGNATDWCKVTGPDWARVVTVQNRGATAGYVSVPGLTSTAAATDHAIKLAAGEHRTLYLGPGGKSRGVATWSVWGGDGAGHAWDFQIEEGGT